MVSLEQKLEILKKLKQILRELPTSNNINEISKRIKIPTSTIQRYLNREDYFEELTEFKLMKPEEVEELKKVVVIWLRQAKEDGLKQGGKKSQAMFGYSKASDGTFIGRGK